MSEESFIAGRSIIRIQKVVRNDKRVTGGMGKTRDARSENARFDDG